MGERVIQIVVVVLAVMVAFTIIGWVLKALWWTAVVAAGVVLGGLILSRIGKD